MAPDILGEGARPRPELIAAVVLDGTHLDAADMPGEATQLHASHAGLLPLDHAHLESQFIRKSASSRHSIQRQPHRVATCLAVQWIRDSETEGICAGAGATSAEPCFSADPGPVGEARSRGCAFQARRGSLERAARGDMAWR